MDVVYVVKENQDNLELKYSLRSLKNIKHDKVYIVGHKPYWVRNVIHIPFIEKSVKMNNVRQKNQLIFNHKDISENFIYMNDDFYFLKEMKEVPYKYMGKLINQINYLKNKGFNSSYVNVIEYLYDNFPEGKSFETHTPIVYNKKKALNLYKEYKDIKGFRTFYCNFYNIKSEKIISSNYINTDLIKDCKFYGGEFSIVDGQEFLSSDDNMIGNKEFLQFMEDNFGERCEYERVPKEYNNPKFDYQRFRHIMKQEGYNEAMLYRDFCINSCKK